MSNDQIVHIVEEDLPVRDSLVFLLSACGFSTRVHQTATAFLEVADTLRHSCLLADFGTADPDAIELLQRLRERAPKLPVVILTGQGDVQTTVGTMKAGARDVLQKPCSDEVLIRSIKRVFEEAENRSALIERRLAARRKILLLDERELKVLDAVAAGLPDELIAHQLGLSSRTVSVCRTTVMMKLKPVTLAEIVRMKMAWEIDESRPALGSPRDHWSLVGESSRGQW